MASYVDSGRVCASVLGMQDLRPSLAEQCFEGLRRLGVSGKLVIDECKLSGRMENYRCYKN